MTDEEVTAVHEQVMELIRQRKWIRAAEVADTVSELPNFHPWKPTERHWGLCEKLGDYEKKRNPARAARLYGMALTTLRRITDADIDKSSQQPGIQRLEQKIQLLGTAPETEWWKRWN